MTAPKTYQNYAQVAAESMLSGDLVGAVKSYRKAVELEPRFYQGWKALGKLEYDLGNFQGSVHATESAQNCDPLITEFQAIQQAVQSSNTAKAKRLAYAMLGQEPGHPRAVFTLAHLSQMTGAHEDRVDILREGISHSPGNVVLRQLLVGALEDCGAYAAAINEARNLTKIQKSVLNFLGLATIFLRYGFNEEALEIADLATHLDDTNSQWLSEIDYLRGQALKILGQRKSAVAALRSSVVRNPHKGTAWWALADMKNYNFSKDDKKELTRLINSTDVDRLQKSQAAFTLAKAIELDEGLTQAMPVYAEANNLRGSGGFDPDRYLQAVDNVVGSFTSEALSAQANFSEDPDTPIFILGMPRSGSTLIEQILASHSQIEGTIELPVLPSIKRKAHIHCVKFLHGNYLETFGQITENDLTALGCKYLEESKTFRKTAKQFYTDKLPHNFEHIGLIHKILPHAIIIDARRNPMDCGLSLYKQYFAQGCDFSYQLKHIGAYYQGYLNLMDHWDHVLPGKLLRVQYEDLVQNTEPIVREILSHVGLEFEPACLRFYENTRAVRTASSEQVRQPIYSESLSRWRIVENELQDLKDSLGKSTLDRFNAYS